MTNIRGDQIRDGTITNADVAANAAISASKLDASLATQSYVSTAISSAGVSVPTGTIMMWPTSTAPTGWVICDGVTTVTRNSALGLLIGTTYGIGNGSTTCNVPDLRGRVPIGAGTGNGLTARTLAGIGGVESVSLSAAQSGLPSHSHGGATGGQNYSHSHTVASSTVINLALGGYGYGVAAGSTNTSAASNDHSHSIPTDGGTSGAPHTNMQPYLTLNFIIKL